MLVQLGQRTRNGDVVDLLHDCHGRIRRFLDLAARLATALDVGHDVVRDMAGQIRRYFAEAFPLHLADEDDLIAPRLVGTSATVDAALQRMHADHVDHAPLVARMIELCERIQREPGQLAACAGQLTRLAWALRAALEPHLNLEEQVIFPTIRRLAAAERDAIKAGMKDRRDVVLSTTAQPVRV